MRRVLSSQEVFSLSRLWRDNKHRKNESSGLLTDFGEWLKKELPDISEDRRIDIMLELWQLKIDPATPSWAELAAEAFGVPFESQQSRNSFKDFVHRYAKISTPLLSPGRYAIMLTDDGGTYQLDVVQAFAQGIVTENKKSSQFLHGTSYQRWGSVLHQRLQMALGELQEMINSKVTIENDYQKLFENYPEILFLLGNYDDVRTGIRVQLTCTLCPVADSQRCIPDFFLHDSVTDLWDVLEIKPPFIKGKMIVGKGLNAHEAFGAGTALKKGLDQLKAYGKALSQNEAVEHLKTKYGLRLLRPRMMLLIGRDEDVPTVPNFSKAEFLRAVSDTTDIFTYDQLMSMTQDKFG
jgi:hypothetical protein